MFSIQPCPHPDNSLLSKYRKEGAYTDCYATDISMSVSHARYVNTFYTTFVFKLERFILKWTASRPSTDAEAKQLADGARDTFAAWTVEGRTENQLLMCDFSKRTRSWLMAAPTAASNQQASTLLYFGSAVVPRSFTGAQKPTMGWGFHALLGFHRLYSRCLLAAAGNRVRSALHGMSV